MRTLTSLPLFLQSRILSYLYQEEHIAHRSQLHCTLDYIPCRRPETQISLDGVHTVNDPLPGALLAPALASPVIAAAARKLFDGRLCFLTDLNTGGRLSGWVNAFSGYVQAVTVIDVGEKLRADLSPDISSVVSKKLCCEAVDLFKEITTNDVRLKVLDIVHVPFHECGGMEDTMMTGLCATLENCQSSLKELALPVHHESDVCARALETVTLRHLTVFSIEMRRLSKVVSNKRRIRTGPNFLRMMQAVDGHADRAHGLTTFSELRLISVDDMPCTTVKESGCSDGLFRGIKTLVLNTDYNPKGVNWWYCESLFCSLFSELESLYSSGIPCMPYGFVGRLCKRLKEVHFSHHHPRTGMPIADVSKWHKRLYFSEMFRVRDIMDEYKGKVRTLVTYDSMAFDTIWQLGKTCRNLEYISLFIAEENVYGLPKFMGVCSRLRVLEMLIDDRDFRDWEQLGKGIPRHHKNLRVVEIQTGPRYARRAVCVDIAVGCFLKIVRQIGAHVEKVIFRISAKVRTSTHALVSLCRMMVCCMKHAEVLQHVELDIVPRNPIKQGRSADFSEACKVLRECKDMVVACQPRLNRIDLGMWHYLLYTYVELIDA